MDDALRIQEYLPESFKNRKESEYVSFLWEAFETNYTSGKYQFAVLAFHMLYMTFVYFSVWQIKQGHNDDFKKSLVGFSKDDERKLLEASSPFAFWAVNEARIFRFLKLIGCENDRIGQFARLVQDRNDIAHPNGNIFFSDQISADTKIAQFMAQVDSIQDHMQPVICDCLVNFLSESWNPDEREYEDSFDQIREELIHANYFSQKDIEAALQFDIRTLDDHPDYAAIAQLFGNFKETYSQED